jgi:cytidylate kinase
MATITISREYGSGGDEIATRVSEMLGYRSFDKTLMAQILTETGLSENEVIDYSEDNYKVRSFMDRLFARSSMREINQGNWAEDPTGTRMKEPAILNESHGIALVQGAIRAAYKKGNVVIVGRGGQVILKGLPGVLHVRVQAPLDTRFGHIAYTKNIHLLGLRKEIVERDQAAADYLRRFYDIDWADPMLYDMVINTTQLNVEAAAQMIVAAVKFLPLPEPSPEPTVGVV